MNQKIIGLAFLLAVFSACGDGGSSGASDLNETSSSSNAESSGSTEVSSSSLSGRCSFEGNYEDSVWVIRQRQSSESFCQTVLSVSTNTESVTIQCDGKWLVSVYHSGALESLGEEGRLEYYRTLKENCGHL